MTERSLQPPGSLDGVGVVVTRPAHQAGALCRQLEARGGRVFCFPVIELCAAARAGAADALRDRLNRIQIVVFISANAVSFGLAAIGGCSELPVGLRVAAVGARTAEVLRERGCRVDIVPDRHFDSEGLLALPALHDVAGANILIVRGEGGRELLGIELRRRGANVEYAEVYRRVVPDTDPAPLVKAWARGEVDAVIVTSEQGLRNLVRMLGQAGRRHLLATTVVTLSERIARVAHELGFEQPAEVARQASDVGLVEAVERWRLRWRQR